VLWGLTKAAAAAGNWFHHITAVPTIPRVSGDAKILISSASDYLLALVFYLSIPLP